MSTMLAEIAQILPIIKPEVRPFHSIPIQDCREALIPLNTIGNFAFETPPPYAVAGAPYNGAEPFSLRRGVAEKLGMAQSRLQHLKKGWRIKVFDAYRPVSVQTYMVAYTFLNISREMNLNPLELTQSQQALVLEKVYRIWSPPNQSPLTPPPHSTGSAIDCTLVDESGDDIPMGSPIDFNGDVSNPDYFKDRPDGKAYHENRLLLRDIMHAQDFVQHPEEWWHFSYGDQLWVWLKQQAGDKIHRHAIYGRIDI